MSDDFFAELQDSFLQEAIDLLGKVEALTLALEKNPNSQETYEELARLAHNFKGSGKAVGFDHISKLGHRLEDFILALRGGQISTSPSNLDFLFSCLDRLTKDVHALVSDKGLALDHEDVFQQIEARLKGESKDAIPAEINEPNENSSSPLTNEMVSKTSLNRMNPQGSPASEPSSKASANEVLRIQKGKIDYLLEAFGEQVILQSTLEQYKLNLNADPELVRKTIAQLSKLTFEIQSHALSLTMIQLNPLFTKLERAVRDASRACGKKINVVFEGNQTEVDRSLVDALSDPLTHMVRNAVDHGIENSERRTEIGKPIEGTLIVRAKRAGAQLWIEVQDDGKGLDGKVLREKALKNGLINSAEAEKMSDKDSYQLIFKNGFSTKEAVSEISGRGVGMNVVEESVHQLQGVIEIESKVGSGTCFRLKLPMSLSIFNGAVVRVHSNRFIVPSADISEIGSLNFSEVTSVGKDQSAIQIRDEIFNLVDLRQKLVLKAVKNSEAESAKSKKAFPILISRKFGKFAFVVDEVLGMQKVVQKPLGMEVKCRNEYAAGTILGDGSPGIVLNLQQFLQAG